MPYVSFKKTMKVPTKNLRTVGQCIYCESTQSPLQEEHIVPYALNGEWKLLKASCAKCANITSQFEREVLRNILLPARAKLNLQTRHKRNRPDEFPLTIQIKGGSKTVLVPLEEHLTTMTLPIFALPAYLDQRQYDKGIHLHGVVTIQVGGPSAKKIAERYDTDTLSISSSYKPSAFARLLAKIAYGFSVAAYGMDMIENAYVLPAIRGQSDDIGRWVGCTGDNSLAKSNHLHEMKLVVINGEIHGRVRLLAQFGTPEYLVVVGQLSKYLSPKAKSPTYSNL